MKVNFFGVIDCVKAVEEYFKIHFPKGLTVTLKFLRILPYKIYLFLVDKLVKR